MAYLPPQQNFAHVAIPQPKSNVDWINFVEADPPWAKELKGDFLAGVTIITFRARNPSSTDTAVCRFTVHVLDLINPMTDDCPENFQVLLLPDEKSRSVSWKEPTFTDNVGLDRVTKSKEPGSILAPGKHLISYKAVDKSGNQAECAFTITLRPPDRPNGLRKIGADGLSRNLKTNSLFSHIFVCPYLLAQHTQVITNYLFRPKCPHQRTQSPAPGSYKKISRDRLKIRHHHEKQMGQSERRNPFISLSSRASRPQGFLRDDPGIPLNITLELHPQDAPSSSAGQSDQRALPLSIEQHSFRQPMRWRPNLLQEQASQQDPNQRQEVMKTTTETTSVPGDDVRIPRTNEQDEERRRRQYEIELIKWQENMRKYHTEMERLRVNPRYRTG